MSLSCLPATRSSAGSFSSCTLSFEDGHLPHITSFTKAFTLGRTENSRLSIRLKKETRSKPRFMVCPKTESVHLERQAASARSAATLKADRREAFEVQKRAALHPDVTNVSPAARAASTVHVADATIGPHSRAALVTNPSGAAYHRAYAGGIGSEMAEDVALLYAGAKQAGIEFGESGFPVVPNSDVVRRGIHKRLQKATATKKKSYVDRISKLLGALSGPDGSPRQYAGPLLLLLSRLCPPARSRIVIQRVAAAP